MHLNVWKYYVSCITDSSMALYYRNLGDISINLFRIKELEMRIFLSWLRSFESYTCPEDHLHIHTQTEVLLAYSNVWLWGEEGLCDYWHGNCIRCPWLPNFRQLDSSLHKPFTHFSIPWERWGKYLCFAVDTWLKTWFSMQHPEFLVWPMQEERGDGLRGRDRLKAQK